MLSGEDSGSKLVDELTLWLLPPKKESVGLFDKIKILFDRDEEIKKSTPPHIASEIEKMCNIQLAEQSQLLNLNQKTMEAIWAITKK